MQLFANIAMGAVLAAGSLGPAAWADAARLNGEILHVASQLAVTREAGGLIAQALTTARAALPDISQGTH
jgi:hypothetical protein